MSGQEEFLSNPEAIREALGADYTVRVGAITPIDIVTGTAKHIPKYAARLHDEAVAIETSVDSLDDVVQKLYGALTPGTDVALDDHQARHTLLASNELLNIRDAFRAGEPARATIGRLYDLYFKHQEAVAETSVGHWLRLAGDNLGIDLRLDVSEIVDLYQQAVQRNVPIY